MLTKCQESALSWPSFSPKGSCFFLWYIGLWHSPSFNFQSVTISHLCWIWNAHDGDSKYVLAQSQIVATDDKKYIFNFLNLYWILTVARLKVLMLAYFNKKKTNKHCHMSEDLLFLIQLWWHLQNWEKKKKKDPRLSIFFAVWVNITQYHLVAASKQVNAKHEKIFPKS